MIIYTLYPFTATACCTCMPANYTKMYSAIQKCPQIQTSFLRAAEKEILLRLIKIHLMPLNTFFTWNRPQIYLPYYNAKTYLRALCRSALSVTARLNQVTVVTLGKTQTHTQVHCKKWKSKTENQKWHMRKMNATPPTAIPSSTIGNYRSFSQFNWNEVCLKPAWTFLSDVRQ